MEYPSLPDTHLQADLSDIFVLTSLILAILPSLFARIVGLVPQVAPVRQAKDAPARTAQAQQYPLAPIHAPPPRPIV